MTRMRISILKPLFIAYMVDGLILHLVGTLIRSFIGSSGHGHDRRLLQYVFQAEVALGSESTLDDITDLNTELYHSVPGPRRLQISADPPGEAKYPPAA